MPSDSNSKATTALPSQNGTHVDRPSRALYSAPRGTRRSRSRSRSPFRVSRGEKRRRDTDERPRYDPRRFDVRYENAQQDDRRRQQRSYEGVDDRDRKRSHTRYDDREDRSHSFKRPRTRSRSRSPYRRENQTAASEEKSRNHEKNSRKDAKERSRDSYGNENKFLKPASITSKLASDAEAETKNAKDRGQIQSTVLVDGGSDKYVSRQLGAISAQDGAKATLANVQIKQLEPPEESSTLILDEAALIEERRKRREAIKNKYRGQATPLLVQALHVGSDGVSPTAMSTPATPDTRKSGKTSRP